MSQIFIYKKNNIVIIGSSGHAKVIIDIVEQEGRYTIVGLLDRYREIDEKLFSYPILGQEEDLHQLMKTYSLKGCIIAIGDNFIRSQVATRINQFCPNLPFVNAIHPKVSIAKDVSINKGTVIMSGVSINPYCTIGRLCILNTNSSLDHDSSMGDFSSLAPGVTTGGNCRIGSYAAISIGAVLIHNIHIGEHTVIGAGSTVLQDIQAYRVAYGSPATIIRNRKPGDKYL